MDKDTKSAIRARDHLGSICTMQKKEILQMEKQIAELKEEKKRWKISYLLAESTKTELQSKLDRVWELSKEFDSYRPDTAKRIRTALGDEDE